jgi:hypothetical protein
MIDFIFIEYLKAFEISVKKALLNSLDYFFSKQSQLIIICILMNSNSYFLMDLITTAEQIETCLAVLFNKFGMNGLAWASDKIYRTLMKPSDAAIWRHVSFHLPPFRSNLNLNLL